MDAQWTPIPDYPPYCVNAYGQVRNEYDQVLTADEKERVTLRIPGKKKRRVTVEKLLLLAGLTRCAGPAPSPVEGTPGIGAEAAPVENQTGEVEDLRKNNSILSRALTDAEATLSKARRVNGHLIYMVRKLRAELEASKPPKRTRRGQFNEEDLIPPLECI